VTYIWFISDEFERPIIMMLFLLSYFYYSYNFKNTRSNNNSAIYKLFCVVAIIKFAEAYYTMGKGTFTFDTSIKSGNKSIGSYQDEYPLITGVIFGTHKLRCFMIGGIFLMELASIYVHKKTASAIEKLEESSETKGIALVLYSKMILTILCFLYNFYSKHESNYLELFLWSISKCVLFGLFYFPTVLSLIAFYLKLAFS
jgi:hypothetical protein